MISRGRTYRRRTPKPSGSRIWVYEIQEYDDFRKEWKPFPSEAVAYRCALPARAQITLNKLAK